MSRAEVQPELEMGEPHNRLPLAVGDFPEVEEQDAGASAAAAMHLEVPSTVNGRVNGFTDNGSKPDEDYYRFRARQGQHYVVEVEAQRLGSPLDSVIEVLDSNGNPVPRAKVRAEVETRLVLNDRNSAQDGLATRRPDAF